MIPPGAPSGSLHAPETPGGQAVRPAARRAVPRRAGAVLQMVLFTVVALSFGRLHELIPGAATLPIGKILLPLGFLALLSQPNFARRFRVLRTKQARMFGLLIAAMVVSIPFSLYRSGSLEDLTDFLRGTASLVILVALACASEADLYGVARTMVAAGGALGLAVIAGAGEVIQGRAEAGTTYDPNDMALVGVVVLPMAIWMLRDKSRLWRWVGAACAVGALATVLLSASRGGALGLAAIVIAMAVQYWKRVSMAGKVVAAATLVGGLLAAPQTFWKRVGTLEDPNADYNTTSDLGRLALWKRGLGYFASRPLTGVGLGQFGAAEGAWLEQSRGATVFKWSAAHSIWIQVLAETGILGIIGFLGLYLPTFRDVRRLRARATGRAPPDESLHGLGIALGISIIGFFVAGTFLADAYSPPAMMLAAVAMSYSYLVRQRTLPARAVRRPPNASGFTQRKVVR